MSSTEIGFEGAVFLLSKPNLEFLDISENEISYKINDLARARRRQGVEIIAKFTPLDPNYVDPILEMRCCEFRVNVKPKPFWQWW